MTGLCNFSCYVFGIIVCIWNKNVFKRRVKIIHVKYINSTECFDINSNLWTNPSVFLGWRPPSLLFMQWRLWGWRGNRRSAVCVHEPHERARWHRWPLTYRVHWGAHYLSGLFGLVLPNLQWLIQSYKMDQFWLSLCQCFSTRGQGH